MDEIETEIIDSQTDGQEVELEEVDTPVEPEGKPKETPEARLARLERQTAQLRKKLGKDVDEPKPTKAAEKPTDGLDETQLDYLDVKGISEQEDIDVIESVVKKTGLTVRQALKDDYVVAKLAANKAAREVKDATPSATRRTGGNQGTDLSVLISKYEQSGYDAKTLPDDFKLRAAVVNAVAAKQNTNKPSWH